MRRVRTALAKPASVMMRVRMSALRCACAASSSRAARASSSSRRWWWCRERWYASSSSAGSAPYSAEDAEEGKEGPAAKWRSSSQKRSWDAMRESGCGTKRSALRSRRGRCSAISRQTSLEMRSLKWCVGSGARSCGCVWVVMGERGGEDAPFRRRRSAGGGGPWPRGCLARRRARLAGLRRV